MYTKLYYQEPNRRYRKGFARFQWTNYMWLVLPKLCQHTDIKCKKHVSKVKKIKLLNMKFLLVSNLIKRVSLIIEASKKTKLLNLNIEKNKIKELESSELILPLKIIVLEIKHMQFFQKK